MLAKIFNILKLVLNKRNIFYLFVSGIFSIFASTNVEAQGDLLVTPKRVVFEGTKKSEDLNLANLGRDSATYAISFIQIRMKKDGTMETIKDPDSAQLFADKYLRVFPRVVSLAPNEAQTIKIQFKKRPDMLPGEYRSHLYFRAIPFQKPLGDVDKKKDSGNISVRLVPIFGITMPVIIRVGESNTAIKLSDFSVEMSKDTMPVLKFALNRNGNMSVYGDVSVEYVSPQGKISRAGIVKGLAVYSPNKVRYFNLPLVKAPGFNYRTGKLHIVYTDQSVRATKLAEEWVSLK